MEEYINNKDAELAEEKLEEEAKRSQELAERRLATRELEKFRERVSQVHFTDLILVNSSIALISYPEIGKTKGHPLITDAGVMDMKSLSQIASLVEITPMLIMKTSLRCSNH